MRHLIVAAMASLGLMASASAADLSRPAPVYTKAPAAAAAVYNWGGFYVGAFGDYAVNFTNVDVAVPGGPTIATLGTAPHGWGAGAQAGLRYQVSDWVVGVRGEASWQNLSASTSVGGVGGISLSNATNYLGSLDLQLGYVIAPRLLGYVVGGFAFGGAHPNLTALGTTQAISDTSVGYNAGLGLEFAVTDHVSLFIEGDYYHLGSKQLSIGTPPVLTSSNLFDIAKQTAGINLHF